MTTTRILRITRWIAFGLIALIALGIGFVEFGQRARLERRALLVADNAPAGTVAVRSGVSIGGPFDLIDHNGRLATDETYQGRWMLVFFGYTDCPDDCPLTLQKMATALDALGPLADQIAPLFITVDPARDTPDRLAGYLANFGSRIIGLTGDSEQIAAVAKAYRVYYSPAEHEQSGVDLVSHSTLLYLMNPRGELDELLRPDTDADELAAALRARLASPKRTVRQD
jgi:cytochrome oxidase Cu insertion factor (SCO1/SenC/PrrC family)